MHSNQIIEGVMRGILSTKYWSRLYAATHFVALKPAKQTFVRIKNERISDIIYRTQTPGTTGRKFLISSYVCGYCIARIAQVLLTSTLRFLNHPLLIVRCWRRSSSKLWNPRNTRQRILPAAGGGLSSPRLTPKDQPNNT